MSAFRSAFRFFSTFSGAVGEHAKQGIKLARAERDGANYGYRASWVDDTDAHPLTDISPECMTPKDKARFECGDFTSEGCVILDSDGRVVNSLWGIFDADPDYRRYVEAELLSEVL